MKRFKLNGNSFPFIIIFCFAAVFYQTCHLNMLQKRAEIQYNDTSIKGPHLNSTNLLLGRYDTAIHINGVVRATQNGMTAILAYNLLSHKDSLYMADDSVKYLIARQKDCLSLFDKYNHVCDTTKNENIKNKAVDSALIAIDSGHKWNDLLINYLIRHDL